MGIINNWGFLSSRAAGIAAAPRGGVLGAARDVPRASPPEVQMGQADRAESGGFQAQPGPAQVAPVAAPVGGPGGVVGRRPADDGQKIAALSSIPGFSPGSVTVLTTEGAALPLGPQQRRVAVAFELDGRVAVMWTGLAEDRRTFSDLLTLLHRERYVISARYVASVDLIAMVYEGAGVVARGAGGDDDSRIEQVVNKLFVDAYKKRASDIDIRRNPQGTQVYFRIDGSMVLVESQSPEWGLALARGLFVRGDSDTKQISFQPRSPQSMTVTRRLWLEGRTDPVDVRLRFQSSATYPSRDGFDAFCLIMRVIVIGGGGGDVLSFEGLGFSAPHRQGVVRQLDHASGLTILIGATGSGKSTTLQTMVDHLADAYPDKKILAVEDPPEYPLRALQVPVVIQDGAIENEEQRIRASYLRALRAAMRMDPDTILVGEIRDPPTAAMATNAALTGHRVLTTFHASSLVHCLQRLRSNGVDLDVLGSEGFLRAIISQALVPLLCPACSQPIHSAAVTPNRAKQFARLRQRLPSMVEMSRVRVVGPGCAQCDNKGVKGRTALVEMLIPDVRMQSLISEGNWLGLAHYWSVSRFLEPSSATIGAGLTQLEHGLHLVGEGRICPMVLDDAGIGRIGELIPPATRFNELVRLGVIGEAERQAGLERVESEPHYPGLSGLSASARGGVL